MSIASEITRLQNAKVDIKDAIEGKGVTVPSNASIDTYYDYINQIETGGGGIEIDSYPYRPYEYSYSSTNYSSSTVVTKKKKICNGGLDLPIKWVRYVDDGVELSNGTYTMYNPAGQFNSAEFTISGSGDDRILTFNYFSTSDNGLPMCTVNNKRIYICIDENRANFCTYSLGGAYIYAYANNKSLSNTTINGSTTSGYNLKTDYIGSKPDPKLYEGYLLKEVFTSEDRDGLVLFSFINIKR